MRDPKFYTRSVLMKIIPKYCKGRLIDVGAGRGKYRHMLDKYIEEYVAVDNLSSDYQFSGEKDRKGIGYIADVTKLPFADDEFDSALCTEVIEHVEDPFFAVREIQRVLKPGGYLILASGWLSSYHEEPKDYWRFSLDGYKILGARAGLEFINAEIQGGLFSSLLFIVFRNIELRGSRLFKKLWKKCFFLRRLCELAAEWADNLFKTPDAIGHVVIFKKP